MDPLLRLCVAVCISCLGLSCSRGSGSGVPASDESGEIIYSKFRDPASGLISPVLVENGSGFEAVEVDSPSVVHDPARAAGKFMLYYEATDALGVSTIGLVTSNEEDLRPIVGARAQVIGRGAASSPYSFAATDPTVVVDSRASSAPLRYKMWFEGRSGSMGETSTIVYCTSTDGVTWSSFTSCMGLNASFGQVRTADPTVILEGDTFKMWFEAINSVGGGSFIGYAESVNGVTWTIKDAAGNSGAAAGPVFLPSGIAGFDAYSVGAPCVVLDASFPSNTVGRYKLWYEAGDKPVDVQNVLGYATSVNGLVWSRATLPILTPSSDVTRPQSFDTGDLEHPTAVLMPGIPVGVEGHFLLWYTGDGEANASPNRIGLAKGRQ